MTVPLTKAALADALSAGRGLAAKGKTAVSTLDTRATVARANADAAKAERIAIQAMLVNLGGTITPPTNTNTPTPPTSEPIATEGGQFTLTGPTTIKFLDPASGLGYQKLLGAGTYPCSFDFFGDPIANRLKYCYIKQDAEAPSQISPILNTNQIDGSPGGSTSAAGGGTGGTGNTTPSVTRMPKIKAKLAATTGTVASLLKTAANSITFTQGAQGNGPNAMPGTAEYGARHYFAKANGNGGNAGAADLFSVAYCEGQPTWTPAVNGQANFQCADGTWSQYWTGYSAGGLPIGFNHTGRSIGFCNRITNYRGHLWVDGKLAPEMIWTNPDSYQYADFGSVATRKIVFVADGEFAEIAVKASDIITPYDWMTDHGALKYSMLADSWGQTGDAEVTGLSMPLLQGALLGAEWVGGSAIGGTGYSATTQGTQPNGTDPVRQSRFSANSPDIMDIALIVNDHPTNFPTFPQDVRTVMTTTRQNNPQALLVVTMWASQGSRATNLQGTEAQKRDIILAEIQRQPGPWVAVDGFAGKWYTSAGTSKQNPTGPFITGEGTALEPINDGGNANVMIDEPGGRHPTSAGVRYLCEKKAAFIREAVATM
jgi:hypothetical protein